MFVRRQWIVKGDGPGKPGTGGDDEAYRQQCQAIWASEAISTAIPSAGMQPIAINHATK